MIEELKALSIKQPYASLILYGKIETRNWFTEYRGDILICSSKTPFGLQDIQNISGLRQTNRIIDTLPGYFNTAPLGKAIAIGTLVQCRPMHKDDEDLCFVPWREDLWCWVFDNVRAIEPIPWRGQLGLVDVGDHIKSKIVWV